MYRFRPHRQCYTVESTRGLWTVQAHEGDLDAVLRRASAAGVHKIVVTAGQLPEVKEVGGVADPCRACILFALHTYLISIIAYFYP